MPIWLLNWRIWLALALAAVLTLSHIKAYRSGIHHAQEACAEERAKSEKAAQEQAERNRELMRAAERRYVVKHEAQDRYFVETVPEVKDAAAPLAAYPVPDRVRVFVNDAIACAVGDPAAACGAAGEVPGASAPAGSGDGQ